MVVQYVNHSDPTERQAWILRGQQSIGLVGETNHSRFPKVNTAQLKGKGLAVDSDTQSNRQSGGFEQKGRDNDVWSMPLALLAQKSKELVDEEVSSASTLNVPVVFEMGSSVTRRPPQDCRALEKTRKKRSQGWKRIAKQDVGVLSSVRTSSLSMNEATPSGAKVVSEDVTGFKAKRKAVVHVDDHGAKSSKTSPSTVASGLKPLPSQ